MANHRYDSLRSSVAVIFYAAGRRARLHFQIYNSGEYVLSRDAQGEMMSKVSVLLQGRCFAALLYASFVLFPAFVGAQETLTVGWEVWSPHQFRDVSGQPQGVNIELVKELAKRAGVRVEFREVPWKRGLLELENGTLHVAMSASRTAERERYAWFSRAWFKREYNVMYVRKKDLVNWAFIRSLTDTIGTRFQIGMTRGSVFSDEHETLISSPEFQAQIQIVDKEAQNLEKLMKGRIDGFVADELSGAEMIRLAGYENDISVLFYLYGAEEASSYLMFSKKGVAPELVEKFDLALAAIKSDGTYQTLLDRYLPNRSIGAQ